MEKKDLEVWEIVTEVLTAAAAVVFFGLQVYYKYLYESGIVTLLYHLLPVLLLYTGMTVLQMFPEFLNGRGSEPLLGKVRIYVIRMVRNIKFLLVLGMLIPSVGDAVGAGVNAAYSLLVMAGILLDIGYYLYRIFQYNSKKKK